MILLALYFLFCLVKFLLAISSSSATFPDSSQPQDVQVSSVPPTQNRLRWPLWEFCDVFNDDLSHHGFSSFQAFYHHSSKSTFITFSLWLPSFQNWLAAAVLPLSFFSSRVLYVSTLANDKWNFVRNNSLPRFFLFPSWWEEQFNQWSSTSEAAFRSVSKDNACLSLLL